MNRRHFIASASALVLAGCSSDPTPRDTFYRLGAPARQPALAGGPITGTVEVPPFRADGIINERAILYRDGPRSLAQYSYHAWLESPPTMMQRAFIAMLRDTQSFTMAVEPEARLDREYEMLGSIHQLEHVIAGGSATAAIEIEITLRRVRDNRQLLSKSYRAEAPCPVDNVDAAVAALAQGLDTVFAAMLADLAALPRN